MKGAVILNSEVGRCRGSSYFPSQNSSFRNEKIPSLEFKWNAEITARRSEEKARTTAPFIEVLVNHLAQRIQHTEKPVIGASLIVPEHVMLALHKPPEGQSQRETVVPYLV